MSLSLATPPNPYQQIEALERELFAQRQQLAELQEQLRQERQRNAGVDQSVGQIRAALGPLYTSLQRLFGEMDAVTPQQASPASNPAWEQWKQRLGGATARAIDALMIHGEMNQTQLRIILGCATRTVGNVVAALNQAKLIDKRDGKIRLKQL